MKFLKIILFIVLGIVALIVALAIIAPKEYRVERTVVIDAPPEMVKAQTTLFKNSQTWNPWAARDPNMAVNISGEDGQVGAVYAWEGNEDVGKGMQTITAVSDERVDIDLKFIEPWESEAKTYFLFEPADSGVSVTWGMTGAMTPPMNIFSFVMNMEEAIGKDYEKGLQTLKARCDSLAKTQGQTYNIKAVEYGPKVFIAKKGSISFSDMQAFYSDAFTSVATALQSSGLTPAGPPVGLYYSWDVENETTTLAAGFPVAESANVDGFETVPVEGKALQIEYFGAYEQMTDAHSAMEEYIHSNGYELNELVIEEYVTDPASEPDTAKWRTNIIYLVKG